MYECALPCRIFVFHTAKLRTARESVVVSVPSAAHSARRVSAHKLFRFSYGNMIEIAFDRLF